MAFPTILFNSSTGSDTTASGAGPSTSISGSTGRTRSAAGELKFGLFGATDDLSGVAVDGSAVLYMAISTAGQRNFSTIAATRNVRDTTTGNITSGAAVLSALGSTSGWAVGDVIKVTGAAAAAADLYSTILTVDSGTQVTLNNNAGTSVTGNAVENPKQFTLTTSQGVNTGTTNTAWAVGGKRATCSGTNSRKLAENNGAAGDAMPGWTLRMESGFTDTFAATLSWRRSGDYVSGPIIFEGDPAAGTIPILTFSNNGTAFVFNFSSLMVIENFEMRNTNGSKTASIALSSASSRAIAYRKIKINHSTNNFWKAITFTSVGFASSIQDCTLAHTANVGLEIGSATIEVLNTRIHNTGAVAGVLLTGGGGQPLFMDCLIHDCVGDGIRSTKNAGSLDAFGFTLIHSTIDNCSGDGIEITAASNQFGALHVVLLNNNITNNASGVGLNFTGSDVTVVNKTNTTIRGNNFYGNGSVCNIAGVVREEEQLLDPQYIDTAGGNYGIGSNLKAKGYPSGSSLPIGDSSTYVHRDIGVERREYASNPMVNSGF